MTMITNLSHPGLVERPARSRDKMLIAFGPLAVARPKGCLAFGETTNMQCITRSVIHTEMREQVSSTAVLKFCRADELPLERVIALAAIGHNPQRLTGECNSVTRENDDE
jgi:hypothetical protein